MEKLKVISDEFTKSPGSLHGGMGHEDMISKVDAILDELSGKELKEAAEKFGSRSAKGRKERIEAIKRFISDRREMYRRTIKNKEDSHGEVHPVPEVVDEGGEGDLPPTVREEV